MSTLSLVRQISSDTGVAWNEESMLHVVCDYLDAQKDDGTFEEYLLKRAEEENEEAEDPYVRGDRKAAEGEREGSGGAGQEAPADLPPTSASNAPGLNTDDGRWALIALVIGYNELAKQAKVLGEKMYWRLMRDAAEDRLVEAGGNRFIEKVEGIVEIEVGTGMPKVVLREQDIELMRAAIAEHDEKKNG